MNLIKHEKRDSKDPLAIPECPECHAKMVKFHLELEQKDGGGWISGWLCECEYSDKPKRIERTYTTNPGDIVQVNIKTASGTKVIYFQADERGYTDDFDEISKDKGISISDDIEMEKNQKLFLYFDCDGNFGRRDYQYDVDESGSVEFIGRGTLLKN